MPVSGERLQTTLDGYAKFLQDKDLALPKHQPYLVRRVREFLLSAQGQGGYTLEQTLDMFLAEIGRRVGVNRGRFNGPRTPLLPVPVARGRRRRGGRQPCRRKPVVLGSSPRRGRRPLGAEGEGTWAGHGGQHTRSGDISRCRLPSRPGGRSPRHPAPIRPRPGPRAGCPGAAAIPPGSLPRR